MNVFIYDTDNMHSERLLSFVDSATPCNITAVNPNIDKMFSEIDDSDTNIVFVDTRLHLNDMNSIALSAMLRHKSPKIHIVFISSYLDDLPFCFKRLVRPSGFLLKPINENELISLITEIRIFDEEMRNRRKNTDKICISSQGFKQLVALDDIVCFTTSGKKLVCYVAGGEQIEFYSTLNGLEERYSDAFLRCHSGFLVNKKRIVGITTGVPQLRVAGFDKPFPVSKKHKCSVINYLKSIGMM